MISMGSLCAAMRRAMLVRQREAREEQARLEEKRRRKAEAEAARVAARRAAERSRRDEALRLIEKHRQRLECERAWKEELLRRDLQRLDEDGFRAAARAAREAEIQERQLADMAAMIVRRQR